MKAYMQMFNLWGIVNGDEKEPEEPVSTTVGSGDSAREVPPTAEQKATYAKAKKDWDRDNEAALGAMTLKMRDDLVTHLRDDAESTWDHLEEEFGKETQAQIYQWWKEISRWKIPGKEAPGKEFA